MNNAESKETGEIKELIPRAKILFLQVNPGKKDYLLMAQKMKFERKDLDKFEHMIVSEVKVRKPVDRKGRELEGEKVRALPLLESPETFNAIVVTGSPYMVYEKPSLKERLVAWKGELIDFVKAAVEHNVPVLGICYGEQILAEALGGKVGRMRNREGKEAWEIGYTRVYRAPGSVDDPIMKGLPSEFVVAQNHKDSVFRLPPGGILLLENEYGIQGFRRGEAWGFQFHPEREADTVKDYIRTHVGKIKEAGYDPGELLKKRKNYSGVASKIYSNFLDYVLTHRES